MNNKIDNIFFPTTKRSIDPEKLIESARFVIRHKILPIERPEGVKFQTCQNKKQHTKTIVRSQKFQWTYCNLTPSLGLSIRYQITNWKINIQSRAQVRKKNLVYVLTFPVVGTSSRVWVSGVSLRGVGLSRVISL